MTVPTIIDLIHENLREVVNAGEKLIVTDSQNAHSVEWEGHGLKMDIPAHAAGLAEAHLEIGVVALVAGQFQFPPGTQLVSAVYAIASSKKLVKPVELFIQHCVDLQNTQQAKSLHFVRASCSQPTLPYKFDYMEEGNFLLGSNNGSIKLKRFSNVAAVYGKLPSEPDPFQLPRLGMGYARWPFRIERVVEKSETRESESIQAQPVSPSSTPCVDEKREEKSKLLEQHPSYQTVSSQTEGRIIEADTVPPVVYSGYVYRQQEATRKWLILFLATKHLATLNQYVKRCYEEDTLLSDFQFKFEDENIQLVLDKQQVQDNWTIHPRKHPCILLQEVVDKVGDSYPDPPTCYITLYAEENAAKRLLYDVPITGTQTKNLSFSIECDLPDPSSSSTAVPTTSQPSGRSAAAIAGATSTSTPTSNILNRVDLDLVLQELGPVAEKWYPLGVYLGLDPGVLDIVKRDQKGDTEASKLEMLKAWLTCQPNVGVGRHGFPSWESLVAALRKTQGHNDLAMEIEKKYIK